VLSAGDLPRPDPPPEAPGPAFDDGAPWGDEGHRG
jgi:CRISPR-associated protein Cas1